MKGPENQPLLYIVIFVLSFAIPLLLFFHPFNLTINSYKCYFGKIYIEFVEK